MSATLVLVTHALDRAVRADRIVRMLDGRALPAGGEVPRLDPVDRRRALDPVP